MMGSNINSHLLGLPSYVVKPDYDKRQEYHADGSHNEK